MPADPPDSPDSRPLVPVLLGPTGAGKTALLESLISPGASSTAGELPPVEIVSCDSRQIYRGLEIGSAAPDAALCARLPHHLVGTVEPTETYSAARYRDEALAAIADIFSRGRLPVLAGGSGFYFRALSTGMFDLEVSPQVQSEIRTTVAGLGAAGRLARLKELDPAAVLPPGESQARAGRVHPNDDYRVSRALEICLLPGGRLYSEVWAAARSRNPGAADEGNAGDSPYRFAGWRISVEIDGKLTTYWAALERRAREMVANGIIEEAGRCFERYGACPGLETLGYTDALAAWRGELSREELAERLFISHRQYGKRQRTWFRRESSLWASPRDALARDFLARVAALLRPDPLKSHPD